MSESSESASLTAELILEIQSSLVLYRCLLAAFTIYVFDRVLTFDSEVEYIWRRKKSGVTLLYASMHLLEIATRTCVIAVDLLVLLVTWKETYGIQRSANAMNVKTSIVTLLLRDGTVYFGVLLVINIICLILWVTNVLQAASTFSTAHTHGFLPGRLNTILLSRFFLNLRETSGLRSDGTTDTKSEPSEARFASLVFNSLGGSLALGLDEQLDFAGHTQDGTEELEDFNITNEGESSIGGHTVSYSIVEEERSGISPGFGGLGN
ncbi:uncharacterized protein B0H18DRAFT_1114102 [Fomitopsis serialis]|uniref:uncharacterized protein n=1 Tax=Fomitopsis serialis TaxID=139415 RepID=UPI0020086866|nr:uncharacterized protein B0H18DRAFT_1114102 [Neoantrodia serialis]KAH9935343.1 hypothetical protein B0H18DRAFT_1114102 [Neoantrodia serialis]